MRYLEGEELDMAMRILAEATDVAMTATCGKSHRGVIITQGDAVIGRGSNGPPSGYRCLGDYCRSICGDYAVHAEKNAMFDAMRKGYSVVGARGYHIKEMDGVGVDSRDPSCTDCSKDMLAAGMGEFVLAHDITARKIALYTMQEFHDLSAQHVWKERVDKLRS